MEAVNRSGFDWKSYVAWAVALLLLLVAASALAKGRRL